MIFAVRGCHSPFDWAEMRFRNLGKIGGYLGLTELIGCREIWAQFVLHVLHPNWRTAVWKDQYANARVIS